MWFTLNPVGHNTLGNTVKSLCQQAGIEGYYTNHSLRATTATRGLEKGIPAKYVMERTGHRDVRSLQRYQRPNVEQKIEISRAFDLSSCHEKANSKCERVSDTKNVIDYSKEQVEIDNSKAEEKVKRCENQSSGMACPKFNNCTFFVGNDFLA